MSTSDEKVCSTETKPRKRKDDGSSDVESVKRLRLDQPSTSQAPDSIQLQNEECLFQENITSLGGEIINLSDDVLLMILAHLSPQDLKRLSQSCQRFEGVAQDHTLWTTPDFRSERMVFCELMEYLAFLQASTKFIAVRGHRKFLRCKSKTCCIVEVVMKNLIENCPNLETLIMEDFIIFGYQLPITAFPSTLKHLELVGCQICYLKPSQSYFHGIHTHLPHLEVLVVENCLWLTSHSLMPISKCPNLRVLRLAGCINLGSCVAYTSVAARFGFKSLQVLDVRKTQLCDSEVGCFNQIPTLTHLYLECPNLLVQCENIKHHMFHVDRVEEEGPSDCQHEQKPEDSQTVSNKEALCESPSVIDNTGPLSLTPPDTPDDFALVNLMSEPSLLISDFGITSLSSWDMNRFNNNVRIVRLVAYEVPSTSNAKLEHLVVRNFSGVGDTSLLYLAKLPSLKFLDVRGTSVTNNGVTLFKSERPDVKILSRFNVLMT